MFIKSIIKYYTKIIARKEINSANFCTLYNSHLIKFRMNVPKYRENPVIMKLDSSDFKSLFTEELHVLLNIFKKYGYEIRIAGGAVRDLLLGKKPTDLDFATTATPDQMKHMFSEENVRMINTKGEKHGTITPRINDKENFEITTLRIDVLTDGRHADVMYTTDWLLDANRRDLTINSMFLDFDGLVYDYFFGYDDLKKRRISFVGNPDTRIKEDYLRILRYFRFYGRVAAQADNHEDITLQTISENVSGLERISGERIWSELKKILQGNFSGDLIKTMLHVGVAKYIGLPEKPNIEEFNNVLKRTEQYQLQPITLLSALLFDSQDALRLHERMKFSAYERDLAIFITLHREPKPHVKPLLPYQLIILNSKTKMSDTKEWVIEVLKYRNEAELLQQIENWSIPKFAITGNTLKKMGIKNGRTIGQILSKLKSHWSENDFNVNDEDLLKLIPQYLDEIESNTKEKL